MSIELKNLLQRTLVVPYDDDETERLEKVCSAFVEDEDFNDDTIADLAIMVMTHTSDESQYKKLAELYEQQNGENLTMPKSVCEALGAYVIYKAMAKGDIACNLALLNCMVLMNKKWELTPFPELFVECIEKSLIAVDDESSLELVDDAAFLAKLFGENNELENTTLDDGLLKIMKQTARDAWYHRTHVYINSEELKGYNTYVMVFVALKHIVDSMPWVFLNEQVVPQILELVPNDNSKELTIGEIVEIVRPHYNDEVDLNCQSSILLQVITDKENKAAAWPFMKTTLTVREFAVYLYYELILEKYFE